MYKKIINLCLFALVFFLFKEIDVYAYNEYHAGDKIRFRGNDYYVLEESNSSKDYVYLLRGTPFNSNELYLYGKDEDSNFIYDGLEKNVVLNRFPYYVSDTCNYSQDVPQGCLNNYDSSLPKKIIDNWTESMFSEDELKKIDGYYARILSVDDLCDKLYFESDVGVSALSYNMSDETYNIISNDTIEKLRDTWVSSHTDDNNYTYIFPSYSVRVMEKNPVAPTVYLRKCVIEGSCVDKTYDEYSTGTKIKVHNENYYVIEDSDKYTDYVTVIKEKPLTLFDINQFSVIFNNQKNSVKFKKSNTCSTNKFSLALSYYENSDVKTLIDGWANDTFYDGELKKINGYKARVLDDNDYIFNNQNLNNVLANIINNNTFRLYKEFEEYDDCIEFQNSLEAVNPVVNIKKCAINGTCVTTEKDEYNAGDVVTFKGQTYHVLYNSDKYTNYVTLLKDEPLTIAEMEKYVKYDSYELYKTSYDGTVDMVRYSTGNDNSYDNSEIRDIVYGWAQDTFENQLVYEDKYVARILNINDLTKALGYVFGASTAGTSTTYSYMATENTPDWFKKRYEFMWLSIPVGDSGDYVWTVTSNRTSASNMRSFGQLNPVVNVNKCVLNPNSDSCQKCVRVMKNSNVSITNYKKYSTGDIVNYKGSDYYVLENSGKNDSYIKLLKKEPLTADEINTYGKDDNGNSVVNRYTFYTDSLTNDNIKTGLFALCGEYYPYDEVYLCEDSNVRRCGIPDDIDRYYRYYGFKTVVPGYAYEYENGYGGMQYYSGEDCHIVSNTTRNSQMAGDCNKYYEYDNSNIKTVLDNWAKNGLSEDDLVTVNENGSDYKVRLMYYNELNEITYNRNTNEGKEMFKPDDYEYWLMDVKSVWKNNTAYEVYKDIDIYGIRNFGWQAAYYTFYYQLSYPAVRPVIFLKKSVFENNIDVKSVNLSACSDGTIDGPVSDPDDPEIQDNPQTPVIVDVPSTSKILSIVLIILSITLSVIGILIIVNNIIKSKKEKNIGN